MKKIIYFVAVTFASILLVACAPQDLNFVDANGTVFNCDASESVCDPARLAAAATTSRVDDCTSCTLVDCNF